MNGNVRTQPFICYFCNKLIEHETESGHITICGSVLEPCPNKCGSYIQRSKKMRHMKECQNKKGQTTSKLVKQRNVDQIDVPVYNSYGHSASAVETGQRRVAQDNQLRAVYNEMSKISNKVSVLDQTLSQLYRNIDLVKNQQDNIQAQQNSQQQLNGQFEKLHYQSQMLVEWKRNIETQLAGISREIGKYAQSRAEYEQQYLQLDGKLMSLQDMQADLNVQKEGFLKEQLYSRQANADLRAKVEQFEDFYTQENAAVGSLWTDHNVQIKNLTREVDAASKALEEQRLKYSTYVFDVRAVAQISSENSEKVEIHEREIAELKKGLGQLKVDVEILEECESSRGLIRPGGIVWKITDFNLKMETSKSNDVCFKGPIFYTHDFGYKVRLVIYFNGIKKWRGRHMIACLHVLKGDHDLMLQWPCHIEGNIILRDIQDHNNPKDVSKSITAKRHHGDEDNEEPQESSLQYIFIPHTTLLKSNYLKEDTMFIEIKINNRKRLSETSL